VVLLASTFLVICSCRGESGLYDAALSNPPIRYYCELPGASEGSPKATVSSALGQFTLSREKAGEHSYGLTLSRGAKVLWRSSREPAGGAVELRYWGDSPGRRYAVFEATGDESNNLLLVGSGDSVVELDAFKDFPEAGTGSSAPFLWGPDDRYIIFADGGPICAGLFRYDLSTGKYSQVLPDLLGEWSVYALEWLEKPDVLLFCGTWQDTPPMVSMAVDLKSRRIVRRREVKAEQAAERQPPIPAP
jgi:hypothetical protein